MNILWILPKWPYPSFDGATKAHMALLEDFPKDHTLDILVFDKNEKEDNEDSFKKSTNAREIKRLPLDSSSKVKAFLSSMLAGNQIPATAMRFCSPKAQRDFHKWFEEKKYSHLIFDGLHPASLFFSKGKFIFPRETKIIYRAHNIEAEIWDQVARKTKWPLQLAYENETKKMQKFESLFLKSVHLCACVSKIDEQKLKGMYHLKNIYSIPIGMDVAPNDVLPLEGNRLLFIGRMDWPPNKEGLLWFLKKIWPTVSLRRKDLTLDIVGGFAEDQIMQAIADSTQVQFHGRVDSVAPFYARCILSLIPIWTGSGTRVKAIESAMHSRSFLTTTKGIEGVELEKNSDYLLSDSEEEWIDILVNIQSENCLSLGKAAYAKIKGEYERSSVQKKFLSLLEDLI